MTLQSYVATSNNLKKSKTKGIIPSLLEFGKLFIDFVPAKKANIGDTGNSSKEQFLKEVNTPKTLANRIKKNADILRKSIWRALQVQEHSLERIEFSHNVDEKLIYQVQSFHFGQHDDEFHAPDLEEMKTILKDFLEKMDAKTKNSQTNKMIPVLEYKAEDRNFDETKLAEFTTSIKRAGAYRFFIFPISSSNNYPNKTKIVNRDLKAKYLLHSSLKQKLLLEEALKLVEEVQNSSILLNK